MYEENKKTLIKQIEKLHDLTVSTCEMCGGTYEENIDGGTAYFLLNGKHFKILIERIN